jgi:hypothetical protein
MFILQNFLQGVPATVVNSPPTYRPSPEERRAVIGPLKAIGLSLVVEFEELFVAYTVSTSTPEAVQNKLTLGIASVKAIVEKVASESDPAVLIKEATGMVVLSESNICSLATLDLKSNTVPYAKEFFANNLVELCNCSLISELALNPVPGTTSGVLHNPSSSAEKFEFSVIKESPIHVLGSIY